MNDNNIKSQAEYQDYYMNYLIDIIKSKNKTTAAWNEAAVTPNIDQGEGGSAGAGGGGGRRRQRGGGGGGGQRRGGRGGGRGGGRRATR